MGIKKKMTAWFLVLVMVCSMFVGVPVSATEVDSEQETGVTGFAMTTNFQWNDDGMITEVVDFDREDKWGDNSNWIPFAFGSITDTQGIEPISWEDILVEVKVDDENTEEPTYESATGITYRSCSNVSDEVWNDGYMIYELNFPEAAFGETVEYRFSYSNGKEGEYVSFCYKAKPFGFYKDENDSGTNYLNTIYHSEDMTTFYLLPYTNDENCTLSAGETPFEGKVWNTSGEEIELDVNQYFTITNRDVDEDTETFDGYEIALNKEVYDYETIELRFNGSRTWYNEDGDITDNSPWEEYITISPGIDNDFLLVHDENCDMGTDIQTIRYSKEDNSEVGETRYLVDCAIDEHGDRYIKTYYSVSDIKVYKKEWRWDEDSKQDVEERIEVTGVVKDASDENGNNSLYFTFMEEGDYVISMEENVERDISVHANAWNEFYLSTNADAEAVWEFSTTGSEDDSTLYFIVNDLEDKSLDSISFDAYVEGKKIEDAQKESYFTYEDVSDKEDVTKKIYKIDITATQGFEIVAESQFSNDDYTWNKTNSIWINYVETGLMFGDPVWGDNGLTGELWKDSYAKHMEGEIYSVRYVYLGVTEDGENYTAVEPGAFEENIEDANAQIKINNSKDYIIQSSDEGPFSTDADTVIIDEELAAKGIYGFYMRDNIDITYGGETITITKNLPTIGFYKANEASFDNFISNDYFMSETEMFEGMPIYVLPREDVKNYSYTVDTIDRTIKINGEDFACQHISDEHPAGYYQSASSFNEPITISVSKCAGSFLRLKGEINWEEGEPEPFEQYLSLLYENKDAIILEDNSPHEGFGGCLISESDYKVSQWWQMSGDVYYWVHGKTIQDVVDQLSAVAEAKEVTVDGITYPIKMTDYIWLNTSYFKYSENFANSTQHVVTPSNIKGIIMQAGAEAPYALFDNGNKKGYYQVQEWIKGEEILLLTQVPNDSNYYPVEELSEENAIAQKADYVVSNYDKVWTTELLEKEGYEPRVDEFNNPLNPYPVYLPNLYVDATVEVKMIGNFGNSEANKQIQLGFYEGSTNKSIINGREFSVANIVDEPAIVGDENNQVTVTVTEFKASTECSKAPINGENCEVTLDGENASLRDKIDIYQKGDDDYADAKELAEGKPLKVKLDVNEAKEDDAEAKKVKEQVEKDCNKDKTKPSKVQYLDIDMKYQVGDRDPKAVTETMEEVDITMDIPDSFQQTGKHAKKRRYKVYRYHDGKVDKLDAEFDKDKKKLHFKTDKFSTYALVAEDVVATGIEVTANPSKLSYVEGEMFDTTGMTISLVYSDGTKEAVTGYTVSATNALALTDKTVTIAYEEFTVQVPITVLAGASSGEGSKEEAPQTPQVVLPSIGATAATTNGDCKVTAIGLDGAVEVTFTPSKKNKKAKKVTIDKTVTIDGKEYAVTAIADNAFSGNTKMTSVSIPDTVTKIGSNAFKGCTKLKKVTIPKSVTEIGKNAFYNCKKVTKVTIKSDSLEVIGAGAFRKCSSLKSVTIPEGVTEIGKDAFRDCKKLSKITIKSTKLTKVGKNAFKNIAKKPTIKVPKSKKKDYKKMLKKAGYTKTVK